LGKQGLRMRSTCIVAYSSIAFKATYTETGIGIDPHGRVCQSADAP